MHLINAFMIFKPFHISHVSTLRLHFQCLMFEGVLYYFNYAFGL